MSISDRNKIMDNKLTCQKFSIKFIRNMEFTVKCFLSPWHISYYIKYQGLFFLKLKITITLKLVESPYIGKLYIGHRMVLAIFLFLAL